MKFSICTIDWMIWKRAKLTKLLLISGSPIEGSSVEILLEEVAKGFRQSFEPEQVQVELVRLNELTIKACQACGEAPQPEFCFFDDGMSDLYRKLIDCEAMVVGSPIYFDSVSAQTKLFIDRCNCMRPGDFSDGPEGNKFGRLIDRKRQGGMVLVGGERGYYEGARRVIAGFYKWVRVVNHGLVTYESHDMRLKGSVIENESALNDAIELGRKIAQAKPG